MNQSRAIWLHQLADLHRSKWLQNGDIKLLKIAHDLDIEASLWARNA